MRRWGNHHPLPPPHITSVALNTVVAAQHHLLFSFVVIISGTQNDGIDLEI
jgi:hypothetical protein